MSDLEEKAITFVGNLPHDDPYFTSRLSCGWLAPAVAALLREVDASARAEARAKALTEVHRRWHRDDDETFIAWLARALDSAVKMANARAGTTSGTAEPPRAASEDDNGPCACDGAIDDGCWKCSPERHRKPCMGSPCKCKRWCDVCHDKPPPEGCPTCGQRFAEEHPCVGTSCDGRCSGAKWNTCPAAEPPRGRDGTT